MSFSSGDRARAHKVRTKRRYRREQLQLIRKAHGAPDKLTEAKLRPRGDTARSHVASK